MPNPLEQPGLDIVGLPQYLQMKKLLQDRAEAEQNFGLQSQFIKEREQMGPTATPDAQAALAMRFIKNPAVAAQLGFQHGDRQEAIANRLQMFHELSDFKVKALEQQRDLAMSRLKSDEDRRIMKEGYDNQILAITRERDASKREIDLLKINLAQQKLDQGPPAQQPKPLPSPLQKQLTETSELADATDRFQKTFKPEYGGHTFTGELTNVAGRTFGDKSGQAQWWQDYELHQSQVRNKLFGSALTAPEIAAWNKSAINPRMDSEEIKKNLSRRNQLETTAINRLMKGAAVTYNKEQIEAFTGRPIDSGQTGPVRIKSNEEFDALPKGAEFIGPDGKRRKKP